ncbi:MAG: DUF3160 domain-containing protein [Butyrivibrio sp.]|nr:DUF3160 domain-containing protein [Butyrivibrio sp.]
MKKRVIAFLLAFTMVSGAVSGCSGNKAANSGTDVPADGAVVTEKEADASQESSDNGNAAAEASVEQTQDSSKEDAPKNVAEAESVYLLGNEEITYYDKDLVPSVKDYEIAEDFSNVYIADDYKGRVGLDSGTGKPVPSNKSGNELREALIRNHFAIDDEYGDSEFFDVYEANRYSKFPNFITVDSLMHTYHLYYAHLMRDIEMNYIYPELISLSQSLLDASAAQYEEVRGTDWEDAALRNVGFFYVGAYLLDDTTEFPVADAGLAKSIDNEINKIKNASSLEICALTGLEEDYTQFKPRGYYTLNETLQKYFRSMMWYGRIPFALSDKEAVKSALLMTVAIDETGKDKWEEIYKITTFFAGASDDAQYSSFLPIIESAYSKVPSAKDLTTDTAAFDLVMKSAADMPLPKINSIPVNEGEDPVILSYRFMGQRFTIDAAIMQRLVYSAIKENGKGDKRMLPDALDVPAVLGSAEAVKILEEDGATEYEGYTDNVVLLKKIFANDDPANWNASLYSGWLNTLRPLLEKKGEGYPKFMQSEEWGKKSLETFEGSYAELKHDTILYAKQVYAEMGGGDEPTFDDRGYVQPEPVVYSRFIFLSEKTKEGLKGYNMLSADAEKDLDRLSAIAQTLLTISEKELKEEGLTDEEYEFIGEYGGDIEHFWVEAMKDTVDDGLAYSYQAPCPVVADIATDPNGAVLEVGTGKAMTMYVVFPVDGQLRLGSGSVYSFYEFTTGLDGRMTDEEWRAKLDGGYLDENYKWVENKNHPVQPDWTQSYRVNKND